MNSPPVRYVPPAEMRAALKEWFDAHTAPVPTETPLLQLRLWRRKDQARRDKADAVLWDVAHHVAKLPKRPRR